MITDLINSFLYDRGLLNYINKFVIRMQPPVTQEELDRRENKKNKIGVVGDIMMQLTDVQDTTVKLKILKSLLAESISDVEIIDLLQGYIDAIEKGEEPAPEEGASGGEEMPRFSNSPSPEPMPSLPSGGGAEPEPTAEPAPEEGAPEEAQPEGDSYLPSFQELGVEDSTGNSQF